MVTGSLIFALNWTPGPKTSDDHLSSEVLRLLCYSCVFLGFMISWKCFYSQSRLPALFSSLENDPTHCCVSKCKEYIFLQFFHSMSAASFYAAELELFCTDDFRCLQTKLQIMHLWAGMEGRKQGWESSPFRGKELLHVVGVQLNHILRPSQLPLPPRCHSHCR